MTLRYCDDQKILSTALRYSLKERLALKEKLNPLVTNPNPFLVSPKVTKVAGTYNLKHLKPTTTKSNIMISQTLTINVFCLLTRTSINPNCMALHETRTQHIYSGRHEIFPNIESESGSGVHLFTFQQI